MTTHDLTATTDVKSQNYSGVQAHVERMGDNHSNEDIDISKSHFNNTETLLDFDELAEEHYADHVHKVNKKRRGARGTKNSRYENVSDYLKRTDGSAETTSVQFFGNAEDWAEVKADFMKAGFTEEEIAEAMDKGYKSYAEGFNKRNRFIKMTEWTSHHDEKTPHWHSRIFTEGISANGKPLKTLDSALARQMTHIPDEKGKRRNQKRMKEWRDTEDREFFNSIGDALVEKAKEKGVDIGFKMYRKNEHNGLTMTAYKAIKKVENSKQKANDKLVEMMVSNFPTARFVDGNVLFSDERMLPVLKKRDLVDNLNTMADLFADKGIKMNKRDNSLKAKNERLENRSIRVEEREKRAHAWETSLIDRETKLQNDEIEVHKESNKNYEESMRLIAEKSDFKRYEDDVNKTAEESRQRALLAYAKEERANKLLEVVLASGSNMATKNAIKQFVNGGTLSPSLEHAIEELPKNLEIHLEDVAETLQDTDEPTL